MQAPECFAGVGQSFRRGTASIRWNSKSQARARKLSKRRSRIVSRSTTSDCGIEQNGTTKTQENRQFIKDALGRNPMLLPMVEDFSPEAIESLADLAVRIDIAPGETIVKPGHARSGTALWIVGDGEVEVVVDGRSAEKLSAGSCIGDFKYLNLTPRAASITAVTNTTLWELSQQQVSWVYGEPLRAKLSSYATALGNSARFRHESEKLLLKLADSLVEQTYERGDYVFRQGDAGTASFLLYEGQLVLEMNDRELSSVHGDPQAGITPSFGSDALLHNRRRLVSMRVESESARVFALDRRRFWEALRSTESEPPQRLSTKQRWSRWRASLRQALRNRYKAYSEMLGLVDQFSWMPEDVRDRMSRMLSVRIFTKDTFIFQKDAEADACYFLVRGTLSAEIDNRETSRMEGDLSASQIPCFGMRSLFYASPHSVSIRVTSDTAEVLELSAKHFLELEALRPKNAQQDQELGVRGSHCCRMEYRPQDLVELGMLGTGNFGSVTLVQHRPTGCTFALKALSKGYVLAQSMQDCVINERNILCMVSSPFLVRAVAFFNSPQRLLFLT